MTERRLDQETQKVVEKAWKSLLHRFREEQPGGHWTDGEADTGFLKDVDALNALVEPFLMAPSSFADPPLGLVQLAKHLEGLLTNINTESSPTVDGQDDRHDQVYRGFSASPYPYVQFEIDFVDSASSVLRLICNSVQLFADQKQKIPPELEKLLNSVGSTAVDFLLVSCIEDRSGARWPGFMRDAEPGGRKPAEGQFTNLFFTNFASLSLHKALNTPGMEKSLGAGRSEKIKALLPKVTAWVAKQYDPGTNNYWMDEGRTSGPVMGVLYALEVLYTFGGSLTEELRQNAANALAAIMSKMSSTTRASELQTDFFHALPFPGAAGTVSYDDRRYIGAFLGLLALAKKKDGSVVTEDFIRAGDSLFRGVADDWIDDPTNLWDDGRPLICYTLDALVGLIRFVLYGRVDTVNLRENELRAALRDVLASTEVVEAVFSSLVQKARSRKDDELELLSKIKDLNQSIKV
jgi:hypothetical protein